AGGSSSLRAASRSSWVIGVSPCGEGVRFAGDNVGKSGRGCKLVVQSGNRATGGRTGPSAAQSSLPPTGLDSGCDVCCNGGLLPVSTHNRETLMRHLRVLLLGTFCGMALLPTDEVHADESATITTGTALEV